LASTSHDSKRPAAWRQGKNYDAEGAKTSPSIRGGGDGYKSPRTVTRAEREDPLCVFLIKKSSMCRRREARRRPGRLQNKIRHASWSNTGIKRSSGGGIDSGSRRGGGERRESTRTGGRTFLKWNYSLKLSQRNQIASVEHGEGTARNPSGDHLKRGGGG